jgi:hypothetical protein
MSKDLFSTQCRLCRSVDNGTLWQMSWIPAHLARPGQMLRLRDNEGWQEGWQVESAWSTQPEEEVRKLSHLHAMA